MGCVYMCVLCVCVLHVQCMCGVYGVCVGHFSVVCACVCLEAVVRRGRRTDPCPALTVATVDGEGSIATGCRWEGRKA